jgi:molybdopterin-guanine dinucleotide biosynthesis protein A
MGGVDKAALEVGGVTLLDRVLAAARPVCGRLVVVGPARPTGVAGVVFVSEAVPGGGPVPAVLAGIDACPGADIVVVVAVDLPLLTTGDLRRLLVALESSGAGAVCGAGRDGAPNPLLAAYRAEVLRVTSAGLGPDAAARLLVPPSAVVEDLGTAALNVNRPEDLTAARLHLAAAGGDGGALPPTSD